MSGEIVPIFGVSMVRKNREANRNQRRNKRGKGHERSRKRNEINETGCVRRLVVVLYGDTSNSKQAIEI